MSLPASTDSGQLRARHFAGLFLLSLATLLLELALTRVLSVALWYHFGFLVISTALLGFGASGVTLALRSEERRVGKEWRSGWAPCFDGHRYNTAAAELTDTVH